MNTRVNVNMARLAFVEFSEKMDNLLEDENLQLTSAEERSMIFALAELQETLLYLQEKMEEADGQECLHD